MTNDQFIRAQLATFAHREGHHHGGIDNMLAAMFVLRNRRQAGWLGGDWMRVIDRAPECAGTLYEPQVIDLRDTCFRMVLAQVDDVVSGLAQDRYTQGALYYAELNKIDRPWFRENVLADLDHHPRVAQVGNVFFFR